MHIAHTCVRVLAQALTVAAGVGAPGGGQRGEGHCSSLLPGLSKPLDECPKRRWGTLLDQPPVRQGPSCCAQPFEAFRTALYLSGLGVGLGHVGSQKVPQGALHVRGAQADHCHSLGQSHRNLLRKKGSLLRELSLALRKEPSSGAVFLVFTTDGGKFHYGLSLAGAQFLGTTDQAPP